MLLKQGFCVLFVVRTHRKQAFYYECSPTTETNADDNIQVNIYDEEMNLSEIPNMNSPSTFYIVDPSGTRDICNPNFLLQAKVIIVTSLDSCRWGGSEFTKCRDDVCGRLKYHPLWNLEELLSACVVLNDAISEETIKQ